MEAAELYTILEAQYFGPNMHEREEMELFPGLLKGVHSFVDVGASLGPYSFVANKILKAGAIVCIEADPVRFHRLKELSEEWERSSDNKINVLHAAAADKAGMMDFYCTDTSISGGLFKHHVPNPALRKSLNWTKTEVAVVTLDCLFKDDHPDLVKIDVEGAEYRVLLGAREILRRGKSRFLVEVHPWGDEPINKTPADVFNLFAQFGYDFSRTHRHWHFQKSKPSLRTFLKNRLIVFIMNNEGLKSVLKRLVLAFGKLRKHKAV